MSPWLVASVIVVGGAVFGLMWGQIEIAIFRIWEPGWKPPAPKFYWSVSAVYGIACMGLAAAVISAGFPEGLLTGSLLILYLVWQPVAGIINFRRTARAGLGIANQQQSPTENP